MQVRDINSPQHDASQHSAPHQSLPYEGPVIVIVGPTGSGKTGVAIEIAKEISRRAKSDASGTSSTPDTTITSGATGAEIISADSRAIYKYMDIGTAKPSHEEQQGIPHFGLDLVEPGEHFTVSDWKDYASVKISEIRSRGNVPIVVGGTGLYIDALVFDYKFRGPTGERLKSITKNATEAKSTEATPEQINCSDRQEMAPDYVIFGIQTDPEILRERLKARVNKLFTQALYQETEFLAQTYGWDSQAMKSNIYQFAWGYLQGEYSLERAKELNFHDDWHLAKRQLTWFKRNDKIIWLPLEKIKPAVLKYI